MKINLDKSVITLEKKQTAIEYAKDNKWMLDCVPNAWRHMLTDLGGYFELLKIDDVCVTYDNYCMCLWCVAWYHGHNADGEITVRASFNLSELAHLPYDEFMSHCRTVFSSGGTTYCVEKPERELCF